MIVIPFGLGVNIVLDGHNVHNVYTNNHTNKKTNGQFKMIDTIFLPYKCS